LPLVSAVDEASELRRTHVKRFREVGLDDAAVVDGINSAAFSDWANRLMLSLGEPVAA
jgi:alkylhydroperoxidase family enzyme